MKVKISFNTLSMVLAAIVLMEGAAIAANARQINHINGLGTGLFQSTVMLGGAQLLVLGLAALLALQLPIYVFQKKEKLNKVLSWFPLVAGTVVLVEGLIVIYYASPMVIQGIGGMRSMWLAAFGAQLFFLGAGLVVLKLFQNRESLKVALRLTLLLALASAGLFIIGIADQAFVSGIGGILKSTLVMGGLQLSMLALAGIALMWLENRPFMSKKLFGHKLGTLAVIGVAAIICLEGMVLASYAAPFSIKSIGGMLERTMLLAGLGLALLGLLISASYYLFEKEDRDARKTAATACLFLVFLLPFSLLV